MNSWEIIKQELTKGAMPNSLGYAMDAKKAAVLFAKLKDVLSDYEIAEKEVDKAVLRSLRESGLR